MTMIREEMFFEGENISEFVESLFPDDVKQKEGVDLLRAKKDFVLVRKKKGNIDVRKGDILMVDAKEKDVSYAEQKVYLFMDSLMIALSESLSNNASGISEVFYKFVVSFTDIFVKVISALDNLQLAVLAYGMVDVVNEESEKSVADTGFEILISNFLIPLLAFELAKRTGVIYDYVWEIKREDNGDIVLTLDFKAPEKLTVEEVLSQFVGRVN